jgi:single-strand DNA-binding protein
MASVNKVIILGRVGKEPEIKHINADTAVANFSLATSESYKNKAGEKVETTEWHSIVAWNRLAEIIEKYVKKGDQLYLEGSIKTRSYEKDGVKKYVTEIVADKIELLGGKKQSTESEKAPDDLPEPPSGIRKDGDDDDQNLPF